MRRSILNQAETWKGWEHGVGMWNLFILKIKKFWSLYLTWCEAPCGTTAEILGLNSGSNTGGMTKNIYEGWDKEPHVEQFKNEPKPELIFDLFSKYFFFLKNRRWKITWLIGNDKYIQKLPHLTWKQLQSLTHSW